MLVYSHASFQIAEDNRKAVGEHVKLTIPALVQIVFGHDRMGSHFGRWRVR